MRMSWRQRERESDAHRQLNLLRLLSPNQIVIFVSTVSGIGTSPPVNPMDRPRSRRLTAAAAFIVLQLCCSITAPSSAALFAPADNHLVDCGSESSAPTILNDRRVFVSDSSFLLPSPAGTVAAASPSTDFASPDLYRTARIFRSPSAYEFEIKKKGAHVVRLHFLPFVAAAGGGVVDLSASRFHVVAAGYVLLTNFGGFGSRRKGPILKEFFVPVESDKLTISFVPVCSESFAFINAIEVVSLPENLVPEVARLIGSGGGVGELSGLSAKAMETLYRINVGGPLVTPYNDTLWRTWVPDAGFVSPSSSPSRTTHFSSRIAYSKFGASREVAPDGVYSSARLLDSGVVSDSDAKLSWAFDVGSSGHSYVVRMHFCEIASMALNELYMNLYVDGKLAYEDFDLSEAAGQVLASPYYIDFVIDAANSRRSPLRVSVAGSKLGGGPSRINALLNGLEIMKLSNSFGSLDGELPAKSVTGNRNSAGFLALLRSVVCGVAFMSLIGVVFMLFMRLRAEVVQNPWRWTRLPVEDNTGIKLAKGGNSMESKVMPHK